MKNLPKYGKQKVLMRAVNVGVGFYFYFEFLNQKIMAYSYEFFIRIKLVIFCAKVWDDDY